MTKKKNTKMVIRELPLSSLQGSAKTLSIKCPYSYLVAAGIKDIENRNWKTKYRGRIYIHSSGKSQGFDPGMLRTNDEILQYLLDDGCVDIEELKKSSKTMKINPKGLFVPLPEF